MRAIFIPFPIATIAILIVTGILTGLQFVFPPILPALERTPTALAQHEWWRLVTPLLVHSDGWKQIAFNFPAILVGVWVERIFGSGPLLLIYGVCGFLGEISRAKLGFAVDVELIPWPNMKLVSDVNESSMNAQRNPCMGYTPKEKVSPL
jgi:membrane associated rhomboid family serine protease